MSNNTAGDFYNPPSALTTDFDEMRFSDVPMDEIFWPNNSANPDQNVAHRKLSEDSAMNTKTRQMVMMEGRALVYQKI